MRLHTLPGRRPAAEIWKAAAATERVENRPAYTKLMEDGVLDRCGMTLLAGKAVGAPFVGAVAATLALAEVLRLLHGGPLHQLMDVDLLSLDQRTASRHPGDFSRLNPGFVPLRPEPWSWLGLGSKAAMQQRWRTAEAHACCTTHADNDDEDMLRLEHFPLS